MQLPLIAHYNISKISSKNKTKGCHWTPTAGNDDNSSNKNDGQLTAGRQTVF